MDVLWRNVHGVDKDAMGRGAMVSLLLIVVVEYEWNIYFAVDRGNRIVSFVLRTPDPFLFLRIGS